MIPILINKSHSTHFTKCEGMIEKAIISTLILGMLFLEFSSVKLLKTSKYIPSNVSFL